MVAYNANENLKDLQKENAVLAFVDENLSDNEAKALQSTLEKIPAQRTAPSSPGRRHGTATWSSTMRTTCTATWILHFSPSVRYPSDGRRTDAAGGIRSGGHPGIVKVRADEAISNGFLTVRNVASLISIALIAVLLVISVFIISNTIKLTTFDRRDEIAIMKMVGATDGFIRWPFVYEGLLIGLMGAVIAFGLQWLLYEAISKGIAGSDTLQLLRVVSFRKIWGPVAGVFGLVGILVGVGGSLTAIRKFLRV